MGTGRLSTRSKSASNSDYKGFNLTAVANKHRATITKVLDRLDQYRHELGIDNLKVDTIELVVRALRSDLLGDINAYGNMRINASLMNGNFTDLLETMVHEYTHHLINSLITKEYGYARGTPEFNYAYINGVVSKSIQEAAFKSWQDAVCTDIREQIAFYSSESKHPIYAEANRRLAEKYTAQLQAVQKFTIADAMRLSGMRQYAFHMPSWSPKGIYRELVTVASERFVRADFNWNKLKGQSLDKQHHFTYYVLQELSRRLKARKQK